MKSRSNDENNYSGSSKLPRTELELQKGEQGGAISGPQSLRGLKM